MKDEDKVEETLKEKCLNAPRLCTSDIDADDAIVSETYTLLPSGKCIICELTLRNGFSVHGESACVSKENFDIEIGKNISRNNARGKVWGFEGYLLQQRLFEEARDACK